MINFYKYQGAGNDFIMINNMDKSISINGVEIKRLCDRHFGIGADGVILLEPSDIADCFMNYYNSDGTRAEMCGNGARCTAAFFIEQTKLAKIELIIDTRAGIKKVACNTDGSFSVNMGTPVFKHTDFTSDEVEIENISFECISMGNPHSVALVDNLADLDLSVIGYKVENDSNFPNKINVEFVEKISDNYYKVAVWERGCGVTLACGTGACAVYAILKKNNRDAKEITLEFPGGKLYLSENPEGQIILRGPATFVYKGEIGS